MHSHAVRPDAPVGDGELAELLVWVHVLQRRVQSLGLLVVQHCVAMAEGPALHVLPAEPHVVACSHRFYSMKSSVAAKTASGYRG